MGRRFKVVALVSALTICFMASASWPPDNSRGYAGDVFAQENPDFISMYRNYLKTMVDKKYAEAWNSMTAGSQRVIARLIASGTLGKYTDQQVLALLETDSNQMRSGFFDYFVREAGLQDFLDNGTYVLKSYGPDAASITITLRQEQKDFRIIRENGAYKFDFFSDLFH